MVQLKQGVGVSGILYIHHSLVTANVNTGKKNMTTFDFNDKNSHLRCQGIKHCINIGGLFPI